MRLGVVVGRAHAAADGQVETLQFAVLDDRDEAEVCAKTSTSFTGGTTIAALNLRGR